MNKDRFYGIIFGLSVGDALGAPIEFEPINERQEIKSMYDAKEKYGVLPGLWTDDTIMTLLLLKSLLEKDGFDARHQLSLYQRWFEDGYMSPTGNCDDIGKACLRAINRFKKTGSLKSEVATDLGNGSLMRTAAVVLAQPQINLESLQELASQCSYVTHGSKLAADCCRYYTSLIQMALNGASKLKLFDYQLDHSYSQSLRELINTKKYQTTTPERGIGGHVLDGLTVALHCFYKTTDFDSGAVMAINMAQDSDTVGAIYGQLAGAYYGLTTINKKWIDLLVQTPMIMELADQAWNSLEEEEEEEEEEEDEEEEEEEEEVIEEEEEEVMEEDEEKEVEVDFGEEQHEKIPKIEATEDIIDMTV